MRSRQSVKTIYPRKCFFQQAELTNPSFADVDLLYRLLDEYFHRVADALWIDYFHALTTQQLVNSATGTGIIGVDTLCKTSYAQSRIAIFGGSFEHQVGWVAPSGSYFKINLVSAAELKRHDDQIRSGLGTSDWGELKLDPFLAQFARCINDVNDYMNSFEFEKAKLHCVFALDVIFGGNAGDSIGKSIVDRAASISFKPVGQSYQHLCKVIKKAYDFRSSYVHRGHRTEVSTQLFCEDGVPEDLGTLVEVVRASFAAGCWARKQTWCDGLEFWHQQIDILSLKLNSGRDTKDEVEFLGLNRIRRVNINPEEEVFLLQN